jgi:hypothetical protein
MGGRSMRAGYSEKQQAEIAYDVAWKRRQRPAQLEDCHMGVIRVNVDANGHNPGSNVVESTEVLQEIVARREIKRLTDQWEVIQARINIIGSDRRRLSPLRRLIAEGDRLSLMIRTFEKFIEKLERPAR